MKTDVKLDNVELTASTRSTVEEEITKKLGEGTLWIGAVKARPEMIYLLWHASGEVPVSMTALRSELNGPDILAVAESFLSKWQRRLH
jgi:hypothetical protein